MINAALAYDLIVIEDEATPLAAKVSGNINYYLLTLMIMALIVLAGMLVSWIAKRKGYVMRLKELNTMLGKDGKVPFTIQSIKDEIALAETDLSASML